ncbi:MAG TPA: zinc ribbon domain-containing protein [Solirubrobacteraceae bacterium]|nr:zinc ribbon domain-containing protein [Solirubrobacteraceae bacterium]
MSTESIASPQPSASGPEAPSCPACGSPVAADQRYCLECGERQAPMSEFLRSGPPLGSSPPATPPLPPSTPDSGAPRNNNASLLAGVGVLLLALGVGVLIGRSGDSSKPSQAPIQVVTQTGGTGASSAPGTEASFTSNWPGTTKGYTVELQTLPITGTTVASVEAAKGAATGKGAGSVGALKSSEFASVGGETYVIYSGVYHKKGEAQKALAGLKKKFPAAKVIEVSSHAAASSESGSNAAAARKKLAPGVGKSLTKPAPPTVLQGPNAPKGKKAEEESKNIPDVVSTG